MAPPPPPGKLPRLFSLVFALLSCSSSLLSPTASAAAVAAAPRKPSDTDALTIFRLVADTHGILASNWTTPDACSGSWRGVACSPSSGRVTSLSLPALDLRGPLDPLAHLDQLRALDLRGNRLNGTLAPALPLLPNLKLLYLSRNDISGDIPAAGLVRLRRLVRLDLSDNSLTGPVPGADALANLTGLLTLRLQDNLLSGAIPDVAAALPNLRDFNISNNELAGRVPDAVQAKFGDASYAGNAGLCGSSPPLPACPASTVGAQGSPSPGAPPVSPIVPSTPSSTFGSSTGPGAEKNGSREPNRENGASGRRQLSPGTVAGIAVGGAVLLLVLASLFLAYYCCGGPMEKGEEEDKGRNQSPHQARNYGNKNKGDSGHNSQRHLYPEAGAEGGVDSRLVFFDKRRRWFELEDLLRASAEMLGKGSLGTVYRAVLEDGSVVAVKRLKDANPCGRKEFERYMDVVGCLRHPNLVRLRAYYYAKQEKLLVYDYLHNGTLFSLLHGSRGRPGRTPLDWTTRISLVMGAARGLARIHEQYSAARIPHGNIKSSNVLLDKNGGACISDFGLALLLHPAHATARLGGYKAPEQAETQTLSQEADVYAFGVLLLEVLTGRAPSQYQLPPPKAAGAGAAAAAAAGAGVDGGGVAAGGVNLPEWVRSVVREEWTAEVFDVELMRYKNIEEEMVAMLHVAMACVAVRAEERPRMGQVVKMLEDIRVELSPLVDEEEEEEPDGESRPSFSPTVVTTDQDGRLSC